MRLYVDDLSFDGQLQRSVGKPDSGWPTHGIHRRCPADKPERRGTADAGLVLIPEPLGRASPNAGTAAQVSWSPFVTGGASTAGGLIVADREEAAQVVQRGLNVETLPFPNVVPAHTGPVESAAESVGAPIQPLAARRAWAVRPRVAGPSDQALHWLAGWYAIALRLGGAVLVHRDRGAGGDQGRLRLVAGRPADRAVPWSAFFTWHVRRSGLTPVLVLADAAVIASLALVQQHLVPATLITDNTTWMLPLACTSIYIMQIALRPRLALPGAAVMVIAYGVGAGDVTDGWLLVAETIVVAGLVAVIRGGAWQADAVVAASLETEGRIRAEEARRADEREQHRQLHDTVLSTLTMVAAGAFAEPSPALTAQAARDLRVLQGLAGAPAVPGRAGAADRPDDRSWSGPPPAPATWPWG